MRGPIDYSIAIASDSRAYQQVVGHLASYGLVGTIALHHQTSGREDVSPAATRALVAEDASGNRLCIKFYADSAAGRDSLRLQAELLRQLHGKIPVPEVLGCEQDAAAFGLPVLITSHVGQSLDKSMNDITGVARMRLVEAIADCISQLAGLSPRGMGLLDVRVDSFAPTSLEQDAAWYADNAPSHDDHVHALVMRGASVLAAHRISSRSVCLAHRDLTGGNIMVSERRLSGLVDWDYSGLDVPERDVGSCISGFLLTLPIPFDERTEMADVLLARLYHDKNEEAKTASFVFALDSIMDWLIGGKNAPRDELIWGTSTVLARLETSSPE